MFSRGTACLRSRCFLFHQFIQRNKAQPVVLDMDVLYPLAPFSLFIVGGAVLKALDFVLFLRKLPLHLFFLGLQLFDFFFGHNFDLLTDR